MSHAAVAAVLARHDLSAGERLVAWSLASFANRDQWAWPGIPAATARAGLSRSRYLELRDGLVCRGLLEIETPGVGRGHASAVKLLFAQSGPWHEGEVNPSCSRPCSAIAEPGTCAAAAGRTRSARRRERQRRRLDHRRALPRRRAGEQHLPPRPGGAARLRRGEGRRRQRRPRADVSLDGPAPCRARDGPDRETRAAAGSTSRCPPALAAATSGSVARAENGPILSGVSAGKGPIASGVSDANGPSLSGVSGSNPAKTPPETPPPNARAGREPRNPRTREHPPTPLKGGSPARSVVLERTYLTERGRKRKRHVRVDLDEIRRRLGLPTATDHDDWRRMRALLRAAAGESVFAIWLEPIELIAIDSQNALVIAPPSATRDWVQKRFGRLLSECAQRASRELRLADDAERAAFERHDLEPPATGGRDEVTTAQRRTS